MLDLNSFYFFEMQLPKNNWLRDITKETVIKKVTMTKTKVTKYTDRFY